MKHFFAVLIVWFMFALAPVLVVTGFLSFVTMDLYLFNPMNWHEGARFLTGAWVVYATACTFVGTCKYYTEEK